jgi:plastocyanin
MNLVRTLGLMLVVALASGLLVACGDDEGDGGSTEATTRAASPTEEDGGGDEETPAGGGGDEEVLEITALETAYDESELTASAGANVRLIFDNDDEGVPHNWSLYESEDSDTPLFEGAETTGVEQIEYEFTAPEEPGTYHFHCDFHPSQMTGDFIVE